MVSRKERSSRPATIALALVLILSLGTVGWVAAGPISLPFQSFNGTLDASAAIDGHELQVTGATNLPDGSIVDWNVDREKLPDGIEPAVGQAVVASGVYAFVADLTNWPPGPAVAWISFNCDWGTVQPKAVTDKVGQQCEHLEGDRVYVDSPGDTKQLAAQVSVSVP